MEHKDLTICHRLESWVYVDDSDRTSAAGFATGDIGRVAYQTDTGQYWRLTDDSPVTWALIAPASPVVYAAAQSGLITPVETTVTTPGVMMGLGVLVTITPTASGKILATIGGTIVNDVAAKLSTAQMRYGTGAAPANGASGTTGSLLGGAAATLGNIAGNGAPFSITGGITGRTLGTPVWFDLQLFTDAGGTARILSASVTLLELP